MSFRGKVAAVGAISGLVVLVGPALVACGPGLDFGGLASADDDGGGGTGDGPPDSGAASDDQDDGVATFTGSGGDDGVGGGGPTSESATFGAADEGDPCYPFGCADFPPEGAPCDVWSDDCEVGEKCYPPRYTGSVGGPACVLAGTQPVGSTCTITSQGNETADTCDARGFCHDIDPSTQVGVCREMCTGTPDAPVCELGSPNVRCRQLNQSALNLCLEDCNPLLPGECEPGHTCVAAFEGDVLGGFICFPPANLGLDGEACSCANCCADGHMCVEAAQYGPGCAFDSCCTRYCDATAPGDTCKGPQQVCLPLYPPDVPGIGGVGQCVVL